ncbi:MAG TPA: hypothetical protein VKZ59_12910 [Acidobacteriota bacterium]|nr:hypothetical protein [Acidobacteriota bacterium]
MRLWFYRFTAAHFCLTSVTGILLYFRPLDDRPGWYTEGLKEILVGLHNGEVWSHLLIGNRYPTGLAIGLVLAVTLIRFSLKSRRNSR